MYICVYICIYVYIHIYTCTCTCMYMYTHIYIYMYIHVYMCIYVYMYICIYVCICIHVYMYVCIYMYTWDSPGRNTRVGCLDLLQEIFPSMTKSLFKSAAGTSLGVQWLRVCLPMWGQGFDSWSGKTPHPLGQQSLSATACPEVCCAE